MPAVQVRHYIQRATDFYEGMQLLKDEDPFRNSSALLAIHAAIAYTDALRVGLGDGNLAADDHKKAVESLRQRLPKQIQDQTGLQHLQFLVAGKSAVSYGDHRLPAKYYALLLTRAVSFARWANDVGVKLKIEGWRNGDQ